MSDGGALDFPRLGAWTSVPLGVSYFPGEIVHFPKLYAFESCVCAMCSQCSLHVD